MHPFLDYQINQTRRQFFGNTGLRLGSLALAMLSGNRAASAQQPAPPVHAPLPGMPSWPPARVTSSRGRGSRRATDVDHLVRWPGHVRRGPRVARAHDARRDRLAVVQPPWTIAELPRLTIFAEGDVTDSQLMNGHEGVLESAFVFPSWHGQG